jgi:hypothetical protein
VHCLSSLHAKESKDIFADACIHGRIDEEFSGGYIAFLIRVGLPVDMNDPDVAKEVNDPSLHSMQGKSKHEIREVTAKATARKKQEIAMHNAALP